MKDEEIIQALKDGYYIDITNDCIKKSSHSKWDTIKYDYNPRNWLVHKNDIVFWNNKWIKVWRLINKLEKI